jgi:N-acetylneuraminate lyase
MDSMVSSLGILMSAIATPYDENGQVAPDILAALVETYIAKGVEGIYCCGSSGEGLLLSERERKTVVRTVCEAAAGRVPVVAHVGALSTAESIRLAAAAAESGVDAISMIPPIYYAYTLEAVVRHYKAVLDAVGMPMILYNIPQFTGTEFSVSAAGELLEDPRVIGVKHTSHNLFALEQMKARYPDKTYINGFDEIFVPAMAAGAEGSIGTTVGMQYELFAAARRRFRDGDIAGAMKAQARISDVIDRLVAIDVFPAAKYLAARDGLALGDCRPPFLPLDAKARRELDELSQLFESYLEKTRCEEEQLS